MWLKKKKDKVNNGNFQNHFERLHISNVLKSIFDIAIEEHPICVVTQPKKDMIVNPIVYIEKVK